ncbi:histidine kinase dimerization/phosphoacceptor domain -containing protein [Sphingomonas sp. AR_OL41]|uniref:sensor histidine kinase n=1 Tax=Sphingomonas sp. AR_OL41 TaxID=3042729 RepID=UPI002480AD1D|nr:histidine kinase dimerization/phosphoacceptor domain -containing protein [Sphingomonas sp. AR_OL41]MDH7975807.1 histidine kinase dimerization/phosphoacceptor domain -containing protein [Sphingomonas sp. AR_OL41]
MASSTTSSPNAPPDLGTALIQAARTPLLVLDDQTRVAAASLSFCRAYGFVPGEIIGEKLYAIGGGIWDLAPLRDLLGTELAGDDGDDVALDLIRPGKDPCRLMAHAQRLDVTPPTRLMLQLTDVTAIGEEQRRLEALVCEKEVLHQELQHRVANSLQIIASILMQSARRVASDDSRTPLIDAHHRVIAIAGLQRQLAASAGSHVAVLPYLRELGTSITAAIIHDSKRVSIHVDGDDSVIDAARSVSLGLIVTELTINAIKHAFPGDDPSGRIDIDYRASGDDWVLTVADNGIGMPPASVVRHGLGTSIVGALADKLRAHVVVASANPGTRVSVTHP